MSTKNIREGQISLRASFKEIDFWNRAWRRQGYCSRSQMIRAGINSVASPKTTPLSPRSVEEIIHLKRIGTALMDIRSMLVVNDNIQNLPGIESSLDEAINQIQELKKG